jgi:hypothetical protein
MPAKQLTVGSLFAGIPPEASTSDLSEPECALSGTVKSTPTPAPSCGSTGLLFPTLETFTGLSKGQNLQTCSAEDRRAKPLASPQPSVAIEAAEQCGLKCGGSHPSFTRHGSSWSNQWATPIGKPRLRGIWRDLASTHADLNCRLGILVRLIFAGECSSLPTPIASDATRSPGSPNHPRMQRARGLRLQEELGARPGPEIVEWMLGFPVGWTALDASAIAAILESRKSSGERS